MSSPRHECLNDETLKQLVRSIPGFPKEGIVFRDITTVLLDASAFKRTVDLIARNCSNRQIDVVCAIEARGLIIGGAVAYKLGVGFAPIRKPGKLPYETRRATYELEYGEDAVEIHVDAVRPGQKALMVDDLLATGGTMEAACRLVEELGGEVVACAFLIELSFLPGRQKLRKYDLFSLVDFETE